MHQQPSQASRDCQLVYLKILITRLVFIYIDRFLGTHTCRIIVIFGSRSTVPTRNPFARPITRVLVRRGEILIGGYA